MKKYDDFDWDKYTEVHYLNEIDIMVREGYDFKIKNSYVENGELVLKEILHPNWLAIYSFIVKNNISSVFEAGCGGCYHLYNIKKLLPEIVVAGCDISSKQIEYAAKLLDIPKDILDNVKIFDFSTRAIFNYDFPRKSYDLVYTQAVLMHLENKKAIRFIYNMKELANKYILMLENQSYEHDFKVLFDQSTILDEFDILDMAYNDVECMVLKRRN